MQNVIDRLNLATMRSRAAVAEYAEFDKLQVRERVALDLVADEVRGQPILDIGVGGGRTVQGLRELSTDYVGVDYSEAMIAACRRRFPDVRFEHGDARQLTMIPDASIKLAVFSCNGISMVGHEDRLAILHQVRRVLKPGGIFIFTTYNLDGPDAVAGYKFPDYDWSKNPARIAVRAARWLRDSAIGLYNRRINRRYEVRTSDHAMINDRSHNYSVMLYYVTIAEQRRQLEVEGFEPNAPVFDPEGRQIVGDSLVRSMLFLARKKS